MAGLWVVSGRAAVLARVLLIQLQDVQLHHPIDLALVLLLLLPQLVQVDLRVLQQLSLQLPLGVFDFILDLLTALLANLGDWQIVELVKYLR